MTRWRMRLSIPSHATDSTFPTEQPLIERRTICLVVVLAEEWFSEMIRVFFVERVVELSFYLLFDNSLLSFYPARLVGKQCIHYLYTQLGHISIDFEVIQKIQISFDFFCRLCRFAGCFTTVQIGEFLNENS